MSKQRYAWTEKIDNEIWSGGPCDSIEECIAEAVSEGYEDGDRIAVGLVVEYKVSYIDSDSIIERLGMAADDEVGEVAEDWLTDVTKEQSEELEAEVLKVVNAWLDKHHLNPTFYKIEPIRYVTIGADTE